MSRKQRFIPCTCGEDSPSRVGVIRFRGKPPGGPFAIGCTRCGAVSLHAKSEKAAWENWEARLFTHKPRQEELLCKTTGKS